jgi:hypothetical protein
MNEWLLVAAGITTILILIGFILIYSVWKQKKEGTFREPNYRVFFILGFVWFPVGIVYIVVNMPLGIAFLGIGVVYMAIGLANKDKWKK